MSRRPFEGVWLPKYHYWLIIINDYFILCFPFIESTQDKWYNRGVSAQLPAPAPTSLPRGQYKQPRQLLTFTFTSTQPFPPAHNH